MIKTRCFLFIFMALLVVTAAPVMGAQAESAIEPQAMATLQKMAQYLSNAQNFSVAIRDGYDVVQDSGQKIEFGETRKITLSRPNRLRVDVERSTGQKGTVFFDGKFIAIHLANDNTYAITSKEGSVDQAIKYTVGELGVQMPLALMLLSTLPSELQNRVVAADTVASTMMDVPCDHIAARTAEGVDFQVWVAQGEQPLPRRIVITYIVDEGQPQFWAEFKDWNLSPSVTDALFTFTPPNGAERIQFLTEIAKSAAIVTEPAKGGKK
ncbi:MAG: DUF2092 domain-containing protein [Syntrophobacteraceae bacterium]